MAMSEMFKEGKLDTVDLEREPSQASTPFYMAWKNISKKVKWKTHEYQILSNCSGIIKSGEMAAIMGLSGSGKTSLLRLLSGRSNLLGCTGEISMPGRSFTFTRSLPSVSTSKPCASNPPVLPVNMRRVVGYLDQWPILLEQLTVTETFAFALGLSGDVRKTATRGVDQLRDADIEEGFELSEIETRRRGNNNIVVDRGAKEVDQLLEKLRLVHCKDKYVSLLSGGERRRVGVGVSLLSVNRGSGGGILILDEPLSGLDSALAISLLHDLHALTHPSAAPATPPIPAAHPSTPSTSTTQAHQHQHPPPAPLILLSLHQASLGMLRLFDKVFVMSDGAVVYAGSPTHGNAYLEQRLGYVPASPNANFAENILDLLLYPYPVPLPQALVPAHLSTLPPKYALRELYNPEPVLQDIESLVSGAKEARAAGNRRRKRRLKHNYSQLANAVAPCPPPPPPPLRQEFYVHLHRCFLLAWRGTGGISGGSRLSAVLEVTGSALLAGGCWFQTPFQESSLSLLVSLLFFLPAFVFFHSLYVSLLGGEAERGVVGGEVRGGRVRVWLYYLARELGAFLPSLFLPLLFSVLALTLTLPASYLSAHPANLPAAVGVLLLTSLTSSSMGEFVSLLTSTTQEAVAWANFLSLGGLLLGGFYIPNPPAPFSYLQWTSVLRYGYDALMQTILSSSVMITCNASSYQLPICAGGLGEVTGAQVRKYLQLGEWGRGLPLGSNLAVLVGLYVGFKMLGYLALQRKLRRQL